MNSFTDWLSEWAAPPRHPYFLENHQSVAALCTSLNTCIYPPDFLFLFDRSIGDDHWRGIDLRCTLHPSCVCVYMSTHYTTDKMIKKKRKEKRICIILPLTSAAGASPLLCSSVLVVSLYISIESFDEARRISSTRSVVEVVGAPLLSSPPVYRWDDDDEEGNTEHWTQYSNCYSLKVDMCMDIDNGESYTERRGWWTHCCWVLLLWCCCSRGICTSRLCICRFFLPSILFVAYLTPGYIIDKPLPIYYWQCGTMSSSSSSSSSWLVYTSINIWYCCTCSLSSPPPLFTSGSINPYWVVTTV